MHRHYAKAPFFITAFLLAVALCCLAAILTTGSGTGTFVADVYQNGELILSIPLDQDPPKPFLIQGENHCFNQITVQDGAIGITAADCPDQLCVHQGFLRTPGLPITCLPNRLVILLRNAASDSSQELTGSQVPDMVTY